MKLMFDIYKNVIEMLTNYRKLTLTSPVLSHDLFVQDMNYREYTIIYGTGDDNLRGKVENITVLIAPNSEYATKTADFKKLLAVLTAKYNVGLTNFCFISQVKFTSHLNKVISKIITKRTKEQNLYFENYIYDKFRINVFKHNMVAEHTITNEKFLEPFNNNVKNLPLIKNTDTPVVWIGARAGMVIELKQISMNTGYSYTYKLCINEKIVDTNDAEQ
jgi:DNA-directed RNA polymerase subunit H (RpoH/RPB5)